MSATILVTGNIGHIDPHCCFANMIFVMPAAGASNVALTSKYYCKPFEC